MKLLIVPVIAALALSGCAVGDQPYPAGWDAIPAQASASCSHLQGSYADRGETAVHSLKPSLTRELFGDSSDWKEATRVQLYSSAGDNWDITVWHGEKKAYTRYLTGKDAEVACSAGRLVVRNKRWVVSDVVSGREHVVMELSLAGQHLIGRLSETTYGVMFAVVPVAAESKRWYRFRRLGP